MSQLQRNIIRQALGLNLRHVSYRKSYVASATCEDATVLSAAVDTGLMTRRRIDPMHCGSGVMYVYEVTRAGAIFALNPGERLDESDFPGVSLQHKMEV